MNPNKSILFIDDDRHLTRSMQDFLLHEGFYVSTAATAEAALKALEHNKPDLIILDISMPGMGGIGFLKHISKEDGTLRYPVLVLTARAAMHEFFSMVAVDGFLPKPCSGLELLRMINSIINKKQSQTITKARQLLIGEDDPVIIPGLVQSFQAAGFKVCTVGSGPEILEQAVTLSPSAIIIKEIFPGMNGSAVSRLLKSIPKTESIPIILHDETRDGGTQPMHKADRYLFSPQFSDLLKAVNALV
jgi:DNA-binding response OmpR family regulator